MTRVYSSHSMARKIQQPDQEWETSVKILSTHTEKRIQQPLQFFLAKFGQAVRCLGRIEATARALYAIVAGAGDSGFRTKFNKTRNQETKCKIQTNIILDYISWGTIQLALISRLCQCNNLNPFENRRLSRIQAIHPCRQWESNGSGLVRSCIFMAKT